MHIVKYNVATVLEGDPCLRVIGFSIARDAHGYFAVTDQGVDFSRARHACLEDAEFSLTRALDTVQSLRGREHA
jgi:hypothetical protein